MSTAKQILCDKRAVASANRHVSKCDATSRTFQHRGTPVVIFRPQTLNQAPDLSGIFRIRMLGNK